MNQHDRRAVNDYIRDLPTQTRAALAADDFEIWCYYGFGVVLNSAQLEAHDAIRSWPRGSVHLWRWANRVGKTSGLVLTHMNYGWAKRGYENAQLERWIDYLYRTLHAAPLNRLMGKAWEMADALIHGSSDLQLNPLTSRQRPAPLGALYTARTGRAKDGSDEMWVECVNNSRIDFLSTQGGAARMESEKWWLLDWDEFVRQQPVADIPLIFDQTLLPRSSDHMAPVILSGTVTEDSDPIYAEIEDIAADSPKDWNIMSFDRSVNFAQSRASIDRQLRLSIDKSVARRSVEGQKGEGGRGALYPTFLLSNAFDGELPPELVERQVELIRGLGYEFISMFDHAANGDLNVVQTWAVPWPVPQGDELLEQPILAVGLAERRSGGHMTPTLQAAFARAEVERYDSRELIVDSTGEGGLLVHRTVKQALVRHRCTVIPCDFGSRSSAKGTINKEEGLQALQRMLGWGLDYAADEYGWVGDWPDVGEGSFGLVRFPFEENWRRLHRELSVLKRDDQHQRQDRAMTAVMGAWRLYRQLETRQALARPFRMTANRRRPKARRQEMIVR
jgi:hypothetical protein